VRFHVAVEEAGGWREVFKATDEGPRGAAWELKSNGYASGPVTADFPPTPARRVRVLIDSCTTPDPKIGHGWLYEVEVFADLPWYDAWRHWFSERSR